MPSITHPAEICHNQQSLDNIKRTLSEQLAKAVCINPPTYTSVNVLLLCWEKNDCYNEKDCSYLSAFLRTEFNYDCEIYQIVGTADDHDGASLFDKVNQFIRKSSNTSLSIIFYSGHAYSNVHDEDRKFKQDLIIYPDNKFTRDWSEDDFNQRKYGVQYRTIADLLDYSKGEVLHILDCCGGGGAALTSHQELLCAHCSFDWSRRDKLWASRGRFTPALINCMKALKNELGHFTAAELHAKMALEAPKMEPPLYVMPWFRLGSQQPHSVTLAPLTSSTDRQQPQPPAPRPAHRSPQVNEQCVLFEITVAAKDVAEVQEFRKWLDNPQRLDHLKHVKIVGYLPQSRHTYKLFFTMPISLWTVLPENGAWGFRDFVKDGEVEWSGME